MNISLQRKIDRYFGAALCRLFSLFSRKTKISKSPVKADKVLVILLSEMGSLVLAYPMLKKIKQTYPQSSLYCLLFEKNYEVLEILDVTSPKKILTINDNSFFTFIIDSIRILITMRRLKFDIIIDCELFARISSIFSYLSGAPLKVGFHRHNQEGLYRGDFINRPIPYNPYNHIGQQFYTLVQSIEQHQQPLSKIELDINDFKAPGLSLSHEIISAAQTKLYAAFPAIKGKKVVLLYPGGGALPIRAWPLEYFCTIGKKLIANGYAIAVIGLAGDHELARSIQSFCSHDLCIDLTGYTKTIKELMTIFHFTDLLITNDGGPGQFAAMTPIPSIIFYGPETPILYGPVDEKAHIFYKPLPCTPCLTAYNHRDSPCDGDNQCLKRINPEDVFVKAMKILASK